MAYATLKDDLGRESVTIVELDLDFCSRTYGSAPCTAAIGVTGADKCFNTRKTCQDPTNYSSAAKTYRFSTPTGSLPTGVNLFPCIKSVTPTPTIINPTGFSNRATIKVVMQDFPHHDRGIDPYISGRSYNASEQGTFFGKLMARNPFVYNRVLRLKTGFIDPTGFDTTFSTDFQTRTYFIDKIEGPDSMGRVTITAKDILKFTNDERAQAPAVSNGKLSAGINDTDTSLTLTPAGIGSEYATSGTVIIGDEIITYTGKSTDTLTGLTRGTDGSTASSHSADDAVQQCLRYTAQPVQDIVEDLLQNYANISASYIPKTDWDAEAGKWLSGYNYTALITKPTGVKSLLDEIIETTQMYLWWDEIAQEVKLKAIAPPLPTANIQSLNDDDSLLEKRTNVRELLNERKSQIWIYYGVIDYSQGIKKENMKNVYVAADSDSESAQQYGTSEVKTIVSRWMPNDAIAAEVSSRFIERFKNPPNSVSFELDASKSDLWTGDFVDITTRLKQNEYGANLQSRYIVTEAREVKPGTTYAYKALEFADIGRIGLIGPNTLSTYDVESDANKNLYAFIALDTGFFSDGTNAYVII